MQERSVMDKSDALNFLSELKKWEERIPKKVMYYVRISKKKVLREKARKELAKEGLLENIDYVFIDDISSEEVKDMSLDDGKKTEKASMNREQRRKLKNDVKGNRKNANL